MNRCDIHNPLEVSHVPPDEASYVWSKVFPMVQRALSHGEGETITAEQVLAAILSGQMHMWTVHRGEEVIAALVLRVQQFARKRRVFVVLLAGRDMPAWADQVERLLLEYKAVVGAQDIDASCRPGLARFLSKRGWKRTAVLMRAPEVSP